MALNETVFQQDMSAASDVAKKIKLEKGISQEFRALFNRIAADSKVFIETFGVAPQLSQYQDEIRSMLLIHYRKTSDAFKNNFRSAQGKPENGTEAEVSAAVSSALRPYINNRATEQARVINETSSNQLNKFLAEAAAATVAAGKELNNSKLAKETSKRFRADGKSRSDTIAMFETQAVAEESKDIETNSLVSAGAVIAGVLMTGQNTVKTWNTILDNKTRFAHAMADGQVVPVGDPFLVDGEFLMQPGDTSLGASLSNVINCRCGSVVSVIDS